MAVKKRNKRLDRWIKNCCWNMDLTRNPHEMLNRTMILKAREEEGCVPAVDTDDDDDVADALSWLGAPYQLRLRRV